MSAHGLTQPAPAVIPAQGYLTFEETPARSQPRSSYGFTILARVRAGCEDSIRRNGAKVDAAIAELPGALATLKLHYLRWVLFTVGTDTYFLYQGICQTDFDKYVDDTIALFTNYGINSVLENLDGFPADWKTNGAAIMEFVREHQCPSFLEHGEHPYVGADEIKKALTLKRTLSEILDRMQ